MPDRITRSISKEEFDSVLEQYKESMIIQNVGLAYGSMIHFLMNEFPLERDNMSDLTLWGWYWRMFQGNEEISNSKTITREFAETELTKSMKEVHFESVHIEKNECILSFSRGFRVIIERRPQEEDGDDLFFLSLPDSKNSILVLTNENPSRFKIEYTADEFRGT